MRHSGFSGVGAVVRENDILFPAETWTEVRILCQERGVDGVPQNTASEAIFQKTYEVVCGLQKIEGGRVFEKRTRRKARGIKGHWARTILGTQIHPWIHDQ
jgi:hypothetical protein